MIKSGIQSQSPLPTNPYKNPLIPSQSPRISFNPPQTTFTNPIISIKTTRNLTVCSGTGASTQMPKQTLYELLGISKSVTLSEIKKAYKQMALKYHPDVSPPDRAEEYTTKFIMVHEAYETLSDPEARAMYDSDMAKGLHLAFAGIKGSRFHERAGEKARWRPAWEDQLVELKRRAVDRGRKVTWADRIRMQRNKPCDYGSDLDQ